MKKCCFIVPYFGQLPKYFEVFAKTCSTNQNYQWLIFTDDKQKYDIPNNVRIIDMSFNELQNMIQNKFDFKISLEKPYKLCDYKPSYGYIFEDYIKDFKFWGHCDLDTIMGNLEKLITDEMLDNYDKIFCLGHMILYKNNFENNRLFMKKYNGEQLYKKVFTTEKICFFDETHRGKNNINSIFEENGKKVFTQDLSLNIRIFPTKFTKITFYRDKYGYEIEKFKKPIYIWNNGNLYRIYFNNRKKIYEEFVYAHLQKRNMRFSKKILNDNCFQMVPNYFIKIKNVNIDYKNFNKIRKIAISFHYLEFHINNKIKKLYDFLNVKKQR